MADTVASQPSPIAAGHVCAGQNVGVTQAGERIWLVTLMRYDSGHLDYETCRLEPIENPFVPKLFTHVSGMKCYLCHRNGPGWDFAEGHVRYFGVSFSNSPPAPWVSA
jgi:hypothetical protein